MVEERGHRWELTNERALEIYELIMQSLDPETWEVLVKSENMNMSLGEFIKKGRTRIIYRPEFNNYNPSIVADDSLEILNSLKITFDNLKHRMEDSFRSILVVNEDMDSFIKSIEQERDEEKQNLKELQEENNDLREEIAQLKEELELKKEGIEPLTDIIQIRIKEIIKLYHEFKKCIGEESEMKKFLPIFQKEVDNTVKLIELKQKQIFENKARTPKIKETKETEFMDDDKESVDDNAKMPESTENLDIPEKFRDTPEEYRDAIKNIKRRKNWSDALYDVEVERYIQYKQMGKEYVEVKS